MIDAWFDFWDRVNWIILFGIFCTLFVVYVVWSMQRNKDSKFEFSEMFQGPSGKTSMGNFWYFIGGAACTFVLILFAVTENENITTIFGWYVSAFVIGKVADKAVDKLGNGKQQADNVDESTQVDTFKVEVPLAAATPATPVAPAIDRPLGKRRNV